MQKHIESIAHLTEVARMEERNAQKLREDHERSSIYSSGQAATLQPSHPPSTQPRHMMFEQHTGTSNFDKPDMSLDIPDHHDIMIPVNITPIDSSAAAREARQNRFQEMYRIMLEQTQHDEEFGGGNHDDGDAEFVESLRQTLSEEALDQDKIAEYFEKTPIESDFSPYPNKLVCNRHHIPRDCDIKTLHRR